MVAVDIMVLEWISCLDKRPADRTGEDLDMIYARLKDLKAFEKFHPLLLQQICYYSYYEDLDQGIILFRQGDVGTNWYAVLSGSLDMNVSETGDAKQDSVTLCTHAIGTAFGESILNDTPRHSTVVTREYCELLRVEQKDFKILWERNKQMIENVLNPYNSTPSTFIDSSFHRRDSSLAVFVRAGKCASNDEYCHPSAPIRSVPSEKMQNAGRVLKSILTRTSPQMISDRKHHLRIYRRCMIGREMVDFLMKYVTVVHSRTQAVCMWQALLEEGVIVHVCREHPFSDSTLYYHFTDEDETSAALLPLTMTSSHLDHKKQLDEELMPVLAILAQNGPDAMMRMILRKAPVDRTPEDLEIIYEELLHIKALSHLSTMVKRELASVLVFEAHCKAGKVCQYL